MVLTQDQTAKIARQLKLLQLEIAEKQEAVENLKLSLQNGLGEVKDEIVGDTVNGFFSVTVRQGAAFNEAYLKKNNPEAWERAKVTKEVVTSASAKSALTADEYAEGQKPHDKFTVIVELLED